LQLLRSLRCLVILLAICAWIAPSSDVTPCCADDQTSSDAPVETAGSPRGLAPAGDSSVARQELRLGVNRTILAWYGKSVDDEKQLLQAMHDCGVRRVRLSSDGAFDRVVEHLRFCNHLGMDVTLDFSAGDRTLYQPKMTPARSNQYIRLCRSRLSDIDPERFRTVFVKFLHDYKQADVRLYAVELFNEINWADFNGDLPLVDGGLVITDKTPADQPDFVAFRKGLMRYGESLRIARHALDEIYGQGRVQLLVAGLTSIPQSWLAKSSGSYVDLGLTLDLLRGTSKLADGSVDYLRDVDGLAIHLYPERTDTSPATAVSTVVNYVRPQIEPFVSRFGRQKAIWITEWSYSRPLFGNPPDEQRRLKQFEYFLDALGSEAFHDVHWGDVLLYNFDSDPPFSIYQNGQLLKTGEILRRKS
jgi:hypothetical protein